MGSFPRWALACGIDVFQAIFDISWTTGILNTASEVDLMAERVSLAVITTDFPSQPHLTRRPENRRQNLVTGWSNGFDSRAKCRFRWQRVCLATSEGNVVFGTVAQGAF